MAYGGKSFFSSSKHLSTSSTLKEYTYGRNDNGSKPVNSKRNGTNLYEPKPSPLNDNTSKRGFNSGTPCTSVAFTPSGKPSAISTMKDASNYKSATPGIFPNYSKPLLFKGTRCKKEFNSGTPCTSTAFTPLGKSPAIRTVKQKDINLTNESHPPFFKAVTLDKANQSTTKYTISSERSQVVSAPKKVIGDSKTSPLTNIAPVTVHQNMIKYYTPLKKSCSVTAVNAMDFAPRNANPKLPLLKATSSVTLHQNMMKLYTPLRKSSAASVEKLKSENLRKETLEKTNTDSSSLRFPDTSSKTVRQNIFSKYFRKSYPSEKTPENLKDFDFESKKFQDPGSSNVPPNIHHGSTSVDLLRCIICIDKERNTVFHPCGHLIVCYNCAKEVNSTCPMCRKHIKKKIKAYIT